MVILSSLVRRWFHGNQASNAQLLAPPPKLSIKPWQMALLRLFGFSIYWEICRFILILLLLFGVIISTLLIYLQILSFMLVLNTLRLTIILYETELRRKRFRFALSSLTINLPMFLLSRFLLLRLLLSIQASGRSSTLSLRGHIIECINIENIIVILLCCNLHHYYCILPYTYI